MHSNFINRTNIALSSFYLYVFPRDVSSENELNCLYKIFLKWEIGIYFNIFEK